MKILLTSADLPKHTASAFSIVLTTTTYRLKLPRRFKTSDRSLECRNQLYRYFRSYTHILDMEFHEEIPLAVSRPPQTVKLDMSDFFCGIIINQGRMVFYVFSRDQQIVHYSGLSIWGRDGASYRNPYLGGTISYRSRMSPEAITPSSYHVSATRTHLAT